MRKMYGEKREILLRSIEDRFGGAVEPWGDASVCISLSNFRVWSLENGL